MFVRLHLLTLMIALVVPAAHAQYSAGFSTIDITPEKMLWLSGYASRDKPAQGVEQPLYAKAFAVRDGNGTEAIFITMDLIGVTPEIYQKTSQAIEQKLGVPPGHVSIASSHTHSGPVLRKNLTDMYDHTEEQTRLISEYTDRLIVNLLKAAVVAHESMQPVIMKYGTGEAGFAINRREYTLNGVRIGLNPIGPVDHDAPFMRVETKGGELLGLIFGYACHNTTLDFYRYCGDYAGYAQEELEHAFPGAVAMFWSGSGGDINPNPRRELDHAKAHGRELAQGVIKAMYEPLQPVNGTLSIAHSTIELPLTAAPGRSDLQQQLNDSNKYIQKRAQSLLATLDRTGSIAEDYPYQLQVWSFGDDLRWIVMAGECVIDYALLFKEKYGPESTWVVSYANDVFAYIPSLRILREGGYESDTSMIYYGLHGPWAEEVEQKIVNEVDRLISAAEPNE